MTERPHGYARYKLDGCRCYTCAWAVAQYRDAREYAMRRGTWQPWTDTAPVREHLRRLQDCHMGLRQVAVLAGVRRGRLQAILNGRPSRGTGPQEKCRPALVAAVLAVEPTLDNLAAAVLIDATGTHRRLRALIARGFPQVVLSAELGHATDNLTLTLAQSKVTARTARAVRALYDRLWNADPADYGTSPEGIARARRHAAANQWAPVGAWDESSIDDPAAHPDWTGLCGTTGGYSAHYNHGILPVCARCNHAHNEARRARKARSA